MLNTPINRLRVIGFIEGVSYLVLLGVAMPLKYLVELPVAVTIVGTIHGVLYILFALAVLAVSVRYRWWSIGWLLGAFVASIVPFGTFVLDGVLRRKQIELLATRGVPDQGAAT